MREDGFSIKTLVNPSIVRKRQRSITPFLASCQTLSETLFNSSNGKPQALARTVSFVCGLPLSEAIPVRRVQQAAVRHDAHQMRRTVSRPC